MKTKLFFLLFLALAGNIFGQTELIQNGNFSGLYSNWSTSGSWYISSLYSCYNSATAYAYVGTGSGNGVNNAYGNLYQTITIPANASSVTLSYHVSINTDEVTTSSTYDYIAVYLTDQSWNPLTSTTTHTYGNIQGSSGSGGCQTYQSHSFSIPNNLFGQTVLVVFHTYTDNAKITKFRVDDVSLMATIPSCTPVSINTQPLSQAVCAGIAATFSVNCNGTPPFSYAWNNAGGPIAGANSASYSTSTAGNYYCIIKNCSNNYQVTSSTATLSIGASPVAPIIAAQGSTSFCQGGSSTLLVTNPASGCTYSWSNGSTGNSITVASAGAYSCISNNSCGTGSTSNAIPVTVNTPPAVAFSQLGYGCLYYFTDNTSGTPVSWNWDFGDPASLENTSTAQNPEHSFSGNGTYNVSLQATNNCGNSTMNQFITVTNCENSGINPNNIDGNGYFSIFPNPIENSAVINFSIHKAGKASIKLYDVLGKQIYTIIESDFNTGDYSIIFARSEGGAFGTYLIRFESHGYSQILQVVFR